jgi:hypothetical protein
MYLNCGCGEYEKRHKPADITMDDLKAPSRLYWEATANYVEVQINEPDSHRCGVRWPRRLPLRS